MASQREIEAAWKKAKGVYLDGRLDFLGHKHRQLGKLFDGLQAQTVDGHTSELELYETLASIRDAVDSLPKSLPKEFERVKALRDAGEGHRRAMGGVVIVRNSSFPLASWAIPLSQAIVDGNAALVISPTDLAPIPSSIVSSLESDAYAFANLSAVEIPALVGSLESIAGFVGANSAPKVGTPVIHAIRHERIALGATAVIIDQSILPHGRPLLPSEESRQVTPSSVFKAARQLIESLCLTHIDGPALGHPAYLLVHENVAPPFIRALGSLLPGHVQLDVQPLIENRQVIERFVSSLGSQLPAKFLPVYTTRSIDSAIDFVQSLAELPRQLYVLAGPQFGGYVVNSIKEVDTILINGFPRSAVALGPYAHRKRFAFVQPRLVVSDASLSAHGVSVRPGAYRSVKIWRLQQDLGKRIDFFGGSFLFAGGMTASTLLAMTSYGLFRAGRWAWSMYVA